VRVAGTVVSVVEQAVSFRRTLRTVDVELVSGEACGLLAEELARVEKACAAVRAMAAARAAACGAHRTAGFADAEDWVAHLTGSSRQQARSDLATGSRLSDCPATKEAATAGELSMGQADEITRTEKEKPGSEDELVAKAKTSSRQQLADECRKRRQAGVDRDELARSQRAKRSFRSWTDGDGMVCGRFRLNPLDGVPLMHRLQALADRIHRQARRDGSSELWDAHAADALVAMLGSADRADGTPAAATAVRSRKAEVVFVVDLRTYRTGEHGDSLCHLVGGGPVPLSVVREMAKDAFLKVVFHDGVNIHTVTHLGRYLRAELRTALELGGPPEFDGIACSVCGKKFRLQWDHVEPLCAGGITTFANEDAKCWSCHLDKSDRERAAGLYESRRRARPVPTPAGLRPDAKDPP
jgi:hypothetical protein